MKSPFPHGKKYCQHDEEGILITLFDMLPEGNKRLCDIGARLAYSNSFRLIEEYDWSGVLLDMNPLAVDELNARLEALRKPNMAVCDKVTPENVNEYAKDCDFLSIDIDSNDFWVWAAVKAVPRVVCIEFNANVDGKWVMPYDVNRTRRIGEDNEGASLDAMIVLGELKGYHLVATSGINAIFLHGSV